MPRAMHPCTKCGTPTRGQGQCPGCRTTADQQRGTAAQRGYDQQHRTQFRAVVLKRDPICRCARVGQHGHGATCTRPSRHADHHPMDRRELVARGLNPNDPKHGRGLCHPCHSGDTGVLQPGGWNARRHA